MDPDGESYKKFKTKRKKITIFERYNIGVMFVFQSIWVRCCPILFTDIDRKYLESQFRFVLYCGSFLWLLYLLI